jgi:hypothetical protein
MMVLTPTMELVIEALVMMQPSAAMDWLMLLKFIFEGGRLRMWV